MAPTLHDIARETKTSISTVSRVLSGGSASQRISPGTIQRVRQAAERLGYRPNLIARSLRTHKTNTIALLASDIGNPFFGQIGSLIEQSLHRRGYSLMVCNSGEDAEREKEYLQLLVQKGIDGLIIVPLITTRKAMSLAVPKTLPLVILDRPIAGVAGGVASDQDQAGGLLCDALARTGISRVAVVAGPQDVVTHRRRAEIVSRRFEVIARHEGPAQKETGRQAYIQFLPLQLQAIVCTNNFLAEGLIECIAEADHPPIIASFDEVPMMHLLPIPIVATQQDIPMLAEACVTQLMGQLAEKPEPPQTVLLPTRAITNRAFQRLHGR